MPSCLDVLFGNLVQSFLHPSMVEGGAIVLLPTVSVSVCVPYFSLTK